MFLLTHFGVNLPPYVDTSCDRPYMHDGMLSYRDVCLVFYLNYEPP